MPVVFHANCVAIEDMEDHWLVGFADHKFETKQYLMLQRAFKFDEQDCRLGMDTYYVEIDGQAGSCYGGIKRFELERECVRVELAHKAKARVGERFFEITFNLGSQEFRKLRNRLKRVFQGESCFMDRSGSKETE